MKQKDLSKETWHGHLPAKLHENEMERMIGEKPKLDFYEMGAGVVAFSSTRHGGCNKGGSTTAAYTNYATFNINSYCGDSEENISKNRKLLCQMLDITDERLIMPHQVHLTKVAKIDEAFLKQNSSERQEALEGVDALMTNVSGLCIGVSTADCIPVLLYDSKHRAVCAIHAGWKGTLQRIVEKAVKAMKDAYDTHPEQIKAQIGPGIHLDSFEVGDEVYEAFAKEGFPMESISRKFVVRQKWHIDLPECNRQQLLAAGVNPQNITVSPVCTYQQFEDYFSARRLGIHSGRIFTGIMMK